jgi:structural maintenance of chromosome 1
MAHSDDEFEYQRATGRIDRLEVENFKSYKGHQQIGPFKDFTAIVGPNGSGKSNLMDAISFVLGVRTQQLRGSLKELLYSNSDTAEQAKPRRGYVKLVYETEEGEEVHFSRVIQPSSAEATATYSSVYKVNDKVVTWDAYSKRLAGFGILVKVRNFLVFQVSVASVTEGLLRVDIGGKHISRAVHAALHIQGGVGRCCLEADGCVSGMASA